MLVFMNFPKQTKQSMRRSFSRATNENPQKMAAVASVRSQTRWGTKKTKSQKWARKKERGKTWKSEET